MVELITKNADRFSGINYSDRLKVVLICEHEYHLFFFLPTYSVVLPWAVVGTTEIQNRIMIVPGT